MIAEFGGSNGVRAPAGLDSAIARPQSGYYKDLIEEAASLWESLSQNHPFIDGNKRTAFATMDVFLKMNGYVLDASLDETMAFVTSFYDSGEFCFEHLEPWLREHAKPL